MKKSNYIVLDFETGGFKPDEHAICEYAGIVVEPINLEIIDKLQFYVKPYEMEYTPGAEKVHKLSKVRLKKDGINFESGMKAIQKPFDKYKTGGRGDKGYPIIVGHNVAFDIRFMSFNFEVMGWSLNDFVKDYHEDTMWLSRKAWQNDKDQALNLGACCEKVGITIENAHSALDDVMATYELFKFHIEVARNGGTATIKKDYPNYQF